MTRITLEKVTRSDSADLFRLWSDFETVKFTNWAHLTSSDQCDRIVERMLRRYDPSTSRVGPFVIRSSEGEFLGLIGLDVPEPFEGAHELWYLIRRDRWNLGYGGAAIAEVLRTLAEFPQVKRMVATAVAANIGSWRLLERNGFSRTGVIAGGFERHGLKLDLFEYARAVPSGTLEER
ncbi:MAG TPA: GNAT family N-acetyltransferase [Opitutaceae bacterium]|nr:GNAT family N-acetyltransferase [Opitutaceae bacterium]